MPDGILIGVVAQHPAQHQAIEGARVDDLRDEDRGLIRAHLDLDADLAQIGLRERGDVLAHGVVVVRHEVDVETHAVPRQHAVGAGTPSRFGEELARAVGVECEWRDAFIEERHRGCERPRRAPAPALDDVADDGVCVDRVRQRLPHAAILERGLAQVPADEGVAERRSREDFKARIALQLRRCRGLGFPQVDLPRLECDAHRHAIRDDAEDDAVEVRRAAKVARVPRQHDLLIRLPFGKTERPRAHRPPVEIRRPPRRGPVCEQVARQHSDGPRIQREGVRLAIDDAHRARIHDLQRLDELEVRAPRRGDRSVHDRAPGELHILRGERLAIVPARILPQMEGDLGTIRPRERAAGIEHRLNLPRRLCARRGEIEAQRIPIRSRASERPRRPARGHDFQHARRIRSGIGRGEGDDGGLALLPRFREVGRGLQILVEADESVEHEAGHVRRALSGHQDRVERVGVRGHADCQLVFPLRLPGPHAHERDGEQSREQQRRRGDEEAGPRHGAATVEGRGGTVKAGGRTSNIQHPTSNGCHYLRGAAQNARAKSFSAWEWRGARFSLCDARVAELKSLPASSFAAHAARNSMARRRANQRHPRPSAARWLCSLRM